MMKKKKSIVSLEDAFSEMLAGKIDRSGNFSPDVAPAEQGEIGRETGDDFQNISFEISDDAMQVVMRAKGARPLPIERLLEALRNLRVTYGIDKEALQLAVDYLKKEGGWPGDLIVARGKRPVSPYEITFPFLEQVGESAHRSIWLVDGMPLFYGLEHLLQTQSRSELNRVQNVLVKAVKYKTVLAQLGAFGEGKPGTNVFSETIQQKEFPLKIGANISYDVQSKSYLSDLYGYVFAQGNKLAVIEPLWITPDKMEAFYVCLPQIGEQVVPGTDELIFLLLKAGWSERCLHYETISKLVQKLSAGERLPVTVQIAAGIQPQRGLDADIVYCHDHHKRAGTFRGDNSIDLRERNAVVAVCKGDLVAEKRMATKGVPGMNILGQPLPPIDGSDKIFQVGDGVEMEKREGRILYYAKTDGNVVLQNKTLSIVEVCQINSDIDYGTGNIAVNTDLIINGSIGAGFSVKCEGNLHVHGAVETGAFVVSKGNVSIDKGVIGETTKIISLGNLYAQYIQDAEVFAKGDIIIGSYIFNGMVRSGGAIIVKKEAESGGGKIVGGVVSASKGIDCSVIGSPTNRNTVVALQASPEKLQILKEFEIKFQEHQAAIMEIMRTSQLDSVDPLAIRKRLEKMEGKNLESFAKLLLNLNEISKEKNCLEQKQKALQKKITVDLEKATIRVSEEAFQGCEVLIGPYKLIIPSDVGPSIFQLQDGKITI